MADPLSPALSLDRLRQARETLTAAFGLTIDGVFAGARDAEDPAGAFSEAKRNLTALVDQLHGREAWQRLLDED